MDLRKVQLTGGSSLTVTLPKAWAEKARLEAGDVVGFLEQADGSLSMHAHAKGERAAQRYVVEQPEGEPDYLFRKIVAAYLMGYDVIVIRSRKPLPAASRLAIRQAVRKVMGLEVVEEEPSSITIQDFLDPREFHVEKALRRMGLLTQAMQEEALGTLAAPDRDALRSVQERDDEVDRLYWLVNKQYHAMLRDSTFATKMGFTPTQALNFLLVARLVERTADHAVRVAEQALAVPEGEAPAALLAKLEKQGRAAAALFRDALQTFFKQDAKRANAIIDQANAFTRTQERLLKDVTAPGGETVAHLAFIVESIGRTAAYAADVGEVAINHKVASAPPS